MPSLLDVSIPVPVVAIGIVALALLLVLLLLRWRQQPFWGIPAALAALLALAVLVIQPHFDPTPPGAPLANYGGAASFADRYDQDRSFFGAPVGSCRTADGILGCYTTYTRMEAHPEQTNPEYQIELGNLGLELAQARHIPLDPHPVQPAVIASYLAAASTHGIDTLYDFGNQRTDPISDGDRIDVYFDKTILSYPANAGDDPSTVRREPVGQWVWSLYYRHVDPGMPDPWSAGRRTLVYLALACLAVAVGPLVLPGLFRRRSAWGGADI